MEDARMGCGFKIIQDPPKQRGVVFPNIWLGGCGDIQCCTQPSRVFS